MPDDEDQAFRRSSGTSNRRPGMTAMLSAASAGAYDIVLAEALDRVSRNQADIASFYQRLEFAGVAMETVSEGKINELHIGLKGTMSALFLKDLGDKVRRGQRGTVARGRVPGGLAYGYQVVHQLDARGEPERGLRRIDPDQAAVVRRIYADYLAGLSPKVIAHRLNAENVPSPRGGEWRASAISGNPKRGIGVLRNPIYSGRYLYNRVSMKRDPESRRRISRENPAEERVWVEMPELRIVDEAIWKAAQEKAEALSIDRARDGVRSTVRAKYLLSGLITCGECDGSMAVIGDGRIGCIRAREAGTCDVRRSIRRNVLEQRVLTGLVDRLLEPEAITRLTKRYHEAMAEHARSRQAERDAIGRRIAKVEKMMSRLVSAIEGGATGFVEIREALQARRDERDALLRQRADIAAEEVIVLNPKVVEDYRKRIRSLASHLNTGTAESAKVVSTIREIVDRVTLRPLNGGEWSIDVMTSLGPVVDLATGSPPPSARRAKGGSTVGLSYSEGSPNSSVKLVAKDRNHHDRPARSHRA